MVPLCEGPASSNDTLKVAADKSVGAAIIFVILRASLALHRLLQWLHITLSCGLEPLLQDAPVAVVKRVQVRRIRRLHLHRTRRSNTSLKKLLLGS